MPEANRQAYLPEFAATANELLRHLEPVLSAPRPGGPVIAVAGESGSGKTVTAVALARALEERGLETAILHQDDYFRLPPRVNHEHRRESLEHVGPHEVNLALMQQHIADFRARRSDVDAPLVDYPTDRFLTRRLDFSATGALVVEGTYVLMLDDLDARIFLEATHDDTRQRREARARDVHEPFVDDVLRLEHQLIAPQAERAELILDRDFRIRARGG